MLLFALLAQAVASAVGGYTIDGYGRYKAEDFGLPAGTTFNSDDRGRMSECAILEHAGPPDRFNANCKAALAAVSRRRIAAPVRKQDWVEGVPLRERFGPGSVRFKLIAGPTGKATSCEILESSGKEPLDRAICNLLIEWAHLVPPADDEGNYVAASYTNTLAW